MNETKLKRIFEAVRRETPPAPPENFDALVMQAVRREPAPAEAITLFDQLNLLFPRLAWASVCIIAVCVAGDFVADAAHLPTVTEGAEQLSEQWLFNEDGF